MGAPHVEDLELPKSLKSGNLTLAKAVIRWMSDNGPRPGRGRATKKWEKEAREPDRGRLFPFELEDLRVEFG
jgi:hypothetical protein